MPPRPPFLRLASCRNLVKLCSSLNILRSCNPTVRSLAYTTTCSYLSSASSSNTSDKLGKLKAINESLEQMKRERSCAVSFLRELKESGFKHDLETYMSVVRLLCHWNLFMDVRSITLLDDVIDNTNWKVDSFEISDHLFETLMEENLVKAVEVLVELYASSGRFEEAIHTLSEMKRRSGVMVSTQTCNFVIMEILKRDKVDMADSVYGQMKGSRLINPNVLTYGILMNGYIKKGGLEKARGLFEQMKEAGVEPNAFIYSMYIHGLCWKGKTDLAFQLVKKLRDSNNKPAVDVIAYACVIRGFVKESKLQDAKDVFLDMKLRGVVPNKYCYCFLILGYFEKGEIDAALDLFKEMESGGIQTDYVIVRLMIRGLCTSGMLDEAVNMFKHFMQQSRPSVFLDGALCKIVIDAACKLGKMDDAMELVEDIKLRRIKPLVLMQAPTLTGVKATYGSDDQKHQNGQNDHSDQKPLAGFQDDQRVQPNVDVDQDEGVEDVPDAAGVHHDVIMKRLRKQRFGQAFPIS